MAWADLTNDSQSSSSTAPRRPTRPARQSYVPPPFRPAANASSRGGGGGRGGGRRGGGRGGGRTQFGAGAGLGPYMNPYHQNPYHQSPVNAVTEKFDDLEVLSDGVNGDVDGDGNGAINFDAYEDIPVEVSGRDVPKAVSAFSEIDLGVALNENVTQRCKYVKPTPIQKHALPISLSGRDLMACAQTGSGKTAAFCFPIIAGILKGGPFNSVGSGRGTRVACPSALILSPTRELSCQIHEEARKFAYNTGVKIVVAYGGAPIVQQFRNLEKGVDILVATPGRLVDMIERGKVSLGIVKYLALDEADRMLDMGFEPQIRKIVQQMDMPPPGERQTMLFSATFPLEIQKLASDFLSDYIFLTVGRVGSSTDLIAQRVELVQDMDKRSRLMALLRDQKAIGTHGRRALTLVFVETKRGADALENWLSMNGFPAIAIHGDKVQMERERALKSFKSGAISILVATDVASRGLDIPHVSHVINFDMPKDVDDYVHRIGRTGRAGKSGMATAFFSDKNMSLAKPLVELMKEAKQEVPSWLIQYAQNPSYGTGGSGGGRNKRYGGSRFGGYDYRNDAQSYGGNNYYNTGAYGTGDPVADSYGSASGSYGDTSGSANYYGVPAMDAGYAFPSGPYIPSQGYEGVVASGWD
ncbi:DEAD-box ATP-dependent RNA helicase 52C-like [Mercurialis annua]|uniref:DEAD-box ATP-dependent RNA helicase 52C-like n=1 Tax=Mercurialis annua TaxID=3986 RepID=UPI00215F5D9E|nr:DEAD-box ATP-dependent RNA helicase 52C-like [Mercurialis annua]